MFKQNLPRLFIFRYKICTWRIFLYFFQFFIFLAPYKNIKNKRLQRKWLTYIMVKIAICLTFSRKKSSRFKSCQNETVQLAYQSKLRQRLLSFRFIPPIEEVRKFWRFWVFEARGSNWLYFSSVKPLELIVFWDKTFASVRKNKKKWKCQKLMLKICWKVDSKMDS